MEAMCEEVEVDGDISESLAKREEVPVKSGGPEDGALGDAGLLPASSGEYGDGTLPGFGYRPPAAIDKGRRGASCAWGSLKGANAREGLSRSTDPTVDKLLSQQNAHHVGAEVNNVLDLPEGPLCSLERKTRR